MRKVILLLVFNGLLLIVTAQESSDRMRFQRLTVADGLTDNSVLTIIQDHLGFIWMGTLNGLVRYDGNKMTAFKYNPADQYSLNAGIVDFLYEDSKGDIWLGASDLIRFERSTQRFISYPKNDKPTNGIELINFIQEDRQGNIWTITTSIIDGSNRIDRLTPRTKTWTAFRNDAKKPQGFAANNHPGDLFNYCFARNGTIWISTRGETTNQLFRFDTKTGQFTPFSIKADAATTEAFKKINWIQSDAKGKLYFSSNVSGIFSLDPATALVKQFKHDRKDSNSIYSDTTWTIYCDSSGFVWICSPHCLDKFDPVTGRFNHYFSKTGDLSTPGAGYLQQSWETAEGDIWFKENTAELTLYQRKANRFLRIAGNLKDKDALNASFGFNRCMVDRTGLLWVATQNSGVNKQVKLNRFPVMTKIPGNTNSLPDSNVNVVYEAPSEPGIIWFGTNTALSRYDKKTGKYTHYKHNDHDKNSLTKEIVTGIVEDKKGRFWVGTRGGLNLMDRKKGTFTPFMNDTANAKSLGHDHIICVKAGADGKLWIATDNGFGGFDYDNNKFVHYTKADTSYTPALFDLISQCTAAGRQVATILKTGNNRNETVAFEIVQSTNLLITGMGEIANPVRGDYGWLEDASGKIIWEMQRANTVGDGGDGTCRVRASVIRLGAGSYKLRYKSDEAYAYGHWIRPAPYHPELWGIQLTTIGTEEAAHFKEEETKKYFNGIEDNNVLSLGEDKEGNIWVGTNAGGVSKFNPATGKFTTFFDALKGPTCVPGSILEDTRTGNLWVGDYIKGLLLIDRNGKLLKRYDNSNGLSSNSIMGMQQDINGIFWISTNNGLTRFDPVTGNSQLYSMQNGLQDAEFNIGSAFCKTTDGELYFAGKNGVNAFYPEQVKIDVTVPQLAFTDLFIAGKPAILGKNGQMQEHISMAHEITLAYDENDLTFYYTTILFDRGNESRFAYQLSPNDKDWTEAGNIRQVRYTNLAPGNYTFTVKACNADGVWNEKGIAVGITILPPWWKTWWAYVLYALVFLGSIFSFIAYRSAALKRENKILEDKVELRTSQLQTSIADLKATQSQLIQSEKMASLGELTAGIAHEIQNPLNFVNNFSDVNKELLLEMKDELDNGNIADAKAIAGNVIENEEKINHHGKRADAIVKGMLQHSRTSNGVKEPVNINALVDEYFRLAYHGLRAKDKSFNAILKTDFDETIGNVNIIPQDIGRVMLNLINNAFYAATLPPPDGGGLTDPDYKHGPTVWVSTKRAGDKVLISVRDNGPGIPQKVLAKIFQPFFTTKPTGQGTGLGLSLSYDIVKAHGGGLKVETKEGEGTEFIIQLPAI